MKPNESRRDRAGSPGRSNGARDSALAILWRQINSPLTWVLLGIAALLVALGRTSDGLIVFGVALLSALIFCVWELLQQARGVAPPLSLESQRRAALDLGRSRVPPPPAPPAREELEPVDATPAPEPLAGAAPPVADPLPAAAPAAPAKAVRAIWTPTGPCEVAGHPGEPAGRFSRRGEALGEAPGDVRRLLLFASLPGDARPAPDGQRHAGADPVEDALATAAEWAGVEVLAARRAFPCRAVLDGTAEHRFTASLHEDSEGGLRVILRGAPEEVLLRCVERSTGKPLPSAETPDAARLPAESERLAARGLTIVAVADRSWSGEGYNLTPEAIASGFRFTGFVGLASDP